MLEALRAVLRRRATPLPDGLRRTLVSVAAIALVIAAVWAWRSADLALSDLRWGPIIGLALVAAPLSLALKAAEFAVAARVAGQRPPRRQAIETAVVSSAANLLPLPGSLLVTVRAIAGGGASYGQAVAASSVPGVAWLGVTGIAGGVAIMLQDAQIVGAAVIIAGIAALAGATAIFVQTAPAEGRVPLAAVILGVELGWLATSALRFTLAAAALGIDLDVAQALTLAVAGAATVAIGFIPGGLGVREAFIAALSPLIDLDVDEGVLLGVLDRVVWLIALGVAATALAVRQRSSSSSADSASS